MLKAFQATISWFRSPVLFRTLKKEYCGSTMKKVLLPGTKADARDSREFISLIVFSVLIKSPVSRLKRATGRSCRLTPLSRISADSKFRLLEILAARSNKEASLSECEE
jgi:hypothetical protein